MLIFTIFYNSVYESYALIRIAVVGVDNRMKVDITRFVVFVLYFCGSLFLLF